MSEHLTLDLQSDDSQNFPVTDSYYSPHKVYNPNHHSAVLALDNGLLFYGYSIGVEGEALGELVFNTSMTGYQEILTDPSYCEQIITMTYPEIGNYGTHQDYMESAKVYAKGFVCKNYNSYPSNFKSQNTLQDFLKENGVVAMSGIDTRELTRIIRETGARKAVISTEDFFPETLIKKAQKWEGLENRDIIHQVSTSKSYKYRDKNSYQMSDNANNKIRIAVIDFGCKENILRHFANRGAELEVFHYQNSTEEILAGNFDGLFLSNGPGDPSSIPQVIENIKLLIGKIPIFGICFGHQVLSQAYGLSTYKLKFGHRGGNQPVKNLKTEKIEITSQNHGFAVQSIKNKAEMISHINCNDNTVEGLEDLENKVFSVQYHPEAAPGPHDAEYLFDRFIQLISQ